MTPEEIDLVQSTFEKVRPISTAAAGMFYGRLFEIAPQVRPLFPEDLAEQKRKLMGMLATAVTNLHQVEKIVPAMQDLGRCHAGYGVTDAHYAPVGEALIWTLDQGLGEAFRPETRKAWLRVYQLVSQTMLLGSAALDMGTPVESPEWGEEV